MQYTPTIPQRGETNLLDQFSAADLRYWMLKYVVLENNINRNLSSAADKGKVDIIQTMVRNGTVSKVQISQKLASMPTTAKADPTPFNAAPIWESNNIDEIVFECGRVQMKNGIIGIMCDVPVTSGYYDFSKAKTLPEEYAQLKAPRVAMAAQIATDVINYSYVDDGNLMVPVNENPAPAIARVAPNIPKLNLETIFEGIKINGERWMPKEHLDCNEWGSKCWDVLRNLDVPYLLYAKQSVTNISPSLHRASLDIKPVAYQGHQPFNIAHKRRGVSVATTEVPTKKSIGITLKSASSIWESKMHAKGWLCQQYIDGAPLDRRTRNSLKYWSYVAAVDVTYYDTFCLTTRDSTLVKAIFYFILRTRLAKEVKEPFVVYFMSAMGMGSNERGKFYNTVRVNDKLVETLVTSYIRPVVSEMDFPYNSVMIDWSIGDLTSSDVEESIIQFADTYNSLLKSVLRKPCQDKVIIIPTLLMNLSVRLGEGNVVETTSARVCMSSYYGNVLFATPETHMCDTKVTPARKTSDLLHHVQVHIKMAVFYHYHKQYLHNIPTLNAVSAEYRSCMAKIKHDLDDDWKVDVPYVPSLFVSKDKDMDVSLYDTGFSSSSVDDAIDQLVADIIGNVQPPRPAQPVPNNPPQPQPVPFVPPGVVGRNNTGKKAKHVPAAAVAKNRYHDGYGDAADFQLPEREYPKMPRKTSQNGHLKKLFYRKHNYAMDNEPVVQKTKVIYEDEPLEVLESGSDEEMEKVDKISEEDAIILAVTNGC
jgi:hypothetical protein